MNTIMDGPQAQAVCTVMLPAALDIDAAGQLAATLRAACAGAAAVRIDASAVEMPALPGLQVVLSALRSGGAVSIADPSPAFAAALAGLGLDGVALQSPALDPPALDTPVLDAAAPAPEPAVAPEPEPETTPEPAAAAVAAPGKRILTIDDSKTMRDMLMLTLAGSGFEVVQAVDGRDGLDVLERETFDVIITDINMPKLDGYGVIEHLRGDRRYDATPILVLTTESDREKKERARALGATGFIVKPFNPASLVDIIRKVSP